MYQVRISSDWPELAENNQFSKLKYALVDYKEGVYINSMPLALCRDFFNDVMYVQHSEERSLGKVYGFKWKYSPTLRQQIKSGRVMMFITTSNPDITMSSINKIEDELGFSNTTIDYRINFVDSLVSTSTHLYDYSAMLSIPSEWFTGGFMLSYFTQLLRFSWYGGDTLADSLINAAGQEAESDFIDVMKSGQIQIALTNWKDIFGTVPLYSREVHLSYGNEAIDEHNMLIHNGSGILSMYKGLSGGYGVEPAIKKYVERLNVVIAEIDKEVS